jgi:heme iron utilization protein
MANSPSDVAASARAMIRQGLKGALATQDAVTGAPYASMILLATDHAGRPLTLISTLARHTRNLAAKTTASLLIDASNASGDAESGGRITLMGNFVSGPPEAARARFLARHPMAETYAGFGDFAFYQFEVESAHFIEGFGRIVPLKADALVPPPHDAASFEAGEAAAVCTLRNRWPAVSGLDCEGVDLRSNAGSKRLLFTTPVNSLQDALDAATQCLAASALSA